MTKPTPETPERTTRRMLKEAQAWADGLPEPRDLEADYRAWLVNQPHVSLKQADDPDIRPGDIVTFGVDGIKHGRPSDYGYVEVVTSKQARHYRRQTLLARLKALFGRA